MPTGCKPTVYLNLSGMRPMCRDLICVLGSFDRQLAVFIETYHTSKVRRFAQYWLLDGAEPTLDLCSSGNIIKGK